MLISVFITAKLTNVQKYTKITGGKDDKYVFQRIFHNCDLHSRKL